MEDQLRDYLKSLILETDTQMEVLESMWNTKLEKGIEVMMCVDIAAHEGIDWDVLEEEARVMNYAVQVLNAIRKKA